MFLLKYNAIKTVTQLRKQKKPSICLQGDTFLKKRQSRGLLPSTSTKSKVQSLTNFEKIFVCIAIKQNTKCNKLIKFQSDKFCEKIEKIGNEKGDHGLLIKISGDFSKLLLLKAHHHKKMLCCVCQTCKT